MKYLLWIVLSLVCVNVNASDYVTKKEVKRREAEIKSVTAKFKRGTAKYGKYFERFSLPKIKYKRYNHLFIIFVDEFWDLDKKEQASIFIYCAKVWRSLTNKDVSVYPVYPNGKKCEYLISMLKVQENEPSTKKVEIKSTEKEIKAKFRKFQKEVFKSSLLRDNLKYNMARKIVDGNKSPDTIVVELLKKNYTKEDIDKIKGVVITIWTDIIGKKGKVEFIIHKQFEE